MKTTELNKVVYQYILDSIDGDVYDQEFESAREKVLFVYSCFKSQHWFDNNIKKFRGNEVNGFADWLQGLPSVINIDFQNHEIILLGVKWGSIPQHCPEWKKDRLIENWFNFIAVKFFQLKAKLEKNTKMVSELV